MARPSISRARSIPYSQRILAADFYYFLAHGLVTAVTCGKPPKDRYRLLLAASGEFDF